MNQLSSRQRKLWYFTGIVILLIPIILLGMPAGQSDERGQSIGGGKLAQLRQEYDLGETSLGNVDPASETMTLVLLGFRGMAVNKLWLDAIDHQKHKNWAQLRANVDSIVLLQPHFLNVWNFQGWNLAYNVSAQWDSVPDRFYWVKEGAKFTMKGTERNRKHPELYWWTGRILGPKIGNSDEWKLFRQFYKNDPDEENFQGRSDPAISTFANTDYDDNYLAAKYWYASANEAEKTQEQHIQMRMLFRQYPARSQLDYADALQREGSFGEKTREAWSASHRDWTEQYENGETGFGREIFRAVPFGGILFLEADTDEEIQGLLDQDVEKSTPAIKRQLITQYQNLANYRYWKIRAKAESDGITEDAHRELYEGKELYKAAKNSQAREKLLSGMLKFEEILGRYPDLLTDDTTIEECLMGYLYLESIYTLENPNQTTIPPYEDLPLRRAAPYPNQPAKNLVQREDGRLPSLRSTFRRESQN